MKRKVAIASLLITTLSSQVYALGVTEILKGTGESLAELVKASGDSSKGTAQSDSKSAPKSSKESSKTGSNSTKTTGESVSETGESVTGTGETFSESTEWLICANKCKKLKDDPALVPAAEKYLQGEAIPEIDREKLVSFIAELRNENPQVIQHPDFDEAEFETAALPSLTNGKLQE